MTERQFTDLLDTPLDDFDVKRVAAGIVRDGLFGAALSAGLDPERAFRASYALEHAALSDPEGFAPYHGRFVDNFHAVTNPSAHRHYAKIMAVLLRKGRLRLTDEQAQQVAETTFDRLIDPRTKPGVRVWTMDILEILSARLPWIAEPLYDTIRRLTETGSPALCSRGVKVCRRLRMAKR